MKKKIFYFLLISYPIFSMSSIQEEEVLLPKKRAPSSCSLRKKIAGAIMITLALTGAGSDISSLVLISKSQHIFETEALPTPANFTRHAHCTYKHHQQHNQIGDVCDAVINKRSCELMFARDGEVITEKCPNNIGILPLFITNGYSLLSRILGTLASLFLY